MTAEELDRVVNINTRAPLLLTAGLIDTIKSQAIDTVFINSTSGLRAGANMAVYDMSKWALRGFAGDLRVELRECDARVMSVFPDMIDTDLAQKPPVLLPKSRHRMIPPEDLARLIIDAVMTPKSMAVNDIVIDRQK